MIQLLKFQHGEVVDVWRCITLKHTDALTALQHSLIFSSCWLIKTHFLHVQITQWSCRVLSSLWWRDMTSLCNVKQRAFPPAFQLSFLKVFPSSGLSPQVTWPSAIFPSLMKVPTNVASESTESLCPAGCWWKVKIIIPPLHSFQLFLVPWTTSGGTNQYGRRLGQHVKNFSSEVFFSEFKSYKRNSGKNWISEFWEKIYFSHLALTQINLTPLLFCKRVHQLLPFPICTYIYM